MEFVNGVDLLVCEEEVVEDVVRGFLLLTPTDSALSFPDGIDDLSFAP